MKKMINLNGQNVGYTLKTSARAKRMRIAVYYDGDCIVTVPKNIDSEMVERFIRAKSLWILQKIKYYSHLPSTTWPVGTKTDYLKYKNEALYLVQTRLDYFNQFYNFKWQKISIKNQKTRWGSCSQKGNLNFNYKIVLLPAEMADYIIVHELCHLGQLNHSAKFWQLVAKTVPNYSQIRNDLRQHRLVVN